MSAVVHAFPLQRRPVPHNRSSQIWRARENGAAADFCAAEQRQREDRRRERLEQMGVVKTPLLMLTLAVFQSLSDAQRREVGQAVTKLAELSPDDNAAQGALWLVRDVRS